jgi:diguanylate cyclase (GGDEF)-like protein
MNRFGPLIRSRLRLGAVRPVLLAAALLIRPASALDPHKAITQYVQTTWNDEGGLPENSVHAVAQTADGYLWFGTEEGLTRFDGVRFVTFTLHNAQGLRSNFIQTLAAGRDGTLWVGTDSGLSQFHPSVTAEHGGTFTVLTARDGLTDNNITALCEDRQGALWVGTTLGLNRIVDGRIENWTSGHGLADAAVRAVSIDAGGTLWVGTENGLSRFTDGRFVTFTKKNGLPDNTVTTLAASPDGSLWVGTLGHGLAQIIQGRIVVPKTTMPWPNIAGLVVDHDGVLWIAFDHHGIGRLYGDRLDLYSVARGLPTDLCTPAIFEDREGSLWVGTLDSGVVQLRDGRFTVFGKSEGLAGNYIGELAEAKDGSIFIGADNNGVDRLYPDGHVEVLDQRNGLPNQPVYSLLVTHDGSLWIGYRRGTLARWDNGRVTVYHDPDAQDASLNALFEDGDGHMWVGYNPKGFAEFAAGSFRHVTDMGIIRYITQSRDGSIWLASDGGGVQRYFHGKLTRYTIADGLPSDHVMYVYADAEGAIWAGVSGGGISRIRDGRVVSWTPEQGIPDTTIGSILEDNEGNLWLGGDNGISRVSKAELERTAGVRGASVHAVTYGQAAGLRIPETLFGSMPCAWKARDGRLWFATIGGAAVVDPAHMPVNRVVPQVQIEGVTFNGRRLPLENGNRIGTGTGNFEVAFTAPTFVAPQLVRFSYRMYGLDKSWVAADARSARYASLPPGHYTFVVEAENADGSWNRPRAVFSFVVLPPLLKRPLAYVFYVVLALLLAWLIVAFRTRSLIRRQWHLTSLVAERTAQLEREKEALEAARRELHIQATHDSLTGLFNRAAILEHLEREVSRSVRDGQPLGVILADLDEFKHINDNYGHLCGDSILRETATRLRAAARGYDLVGRYGGEEFLLLFPGWDMEVAPRRIEDLLDAIRSRHFQVTGGEVRLTISLGVATFRPGVDSEDIWEVLSRADTALYVAKNSGRNTASFEVRST